jgi:hypothetical protein
MFVRVDGDVGCRWRRSLVMHNVSVVQRLKRLLFDWWVVDG